ncbi:MAG TPA: hypothetical protein VFW29_01685 [Solirubrobacteraceae bacterium]|nr:hypothetical protein [Solirubrobacteraceae bacterium]
MTRASHLARRRLPLIAAAALALGLSASGLLPGLTDALTYLLPPVLLLISLVGRRYPGERALLALIATRRRRGRERAHRRSFHPRPRAAVPRGGRLLASSLAVRPPPAPLLAHR